MSRTSWILGALAACLLTGYALRPTAGATTLTLPDLDNDGKPETLLLTAANGSADVRLQATAGKFTHDVLALPGVGVLTARGSAPRWQLVDGAGAVQGEVRLVPSRPGTDLLVVGKAGAKRYRWMDRGFLKLDALTVIPGVSVGLVFLGDGKDAVEAMAGPIAPDGRWQPPLATQRPLMIGLGGDGRVEAIAYADPALVATDGVRVGMDAGALARHMPGKRDGARWLAPMYGLTAALDPHDRVVDIEVRRPHHDEAAAAKTAP